MILITELKRLLAVELKVISILIKFNFYIIIGMTKYENKNQL